MVDNKRRYGSKIDLRKSIEFGIIRDVVRLYTLGMDAKNCMNIIQNILYNGDLSTTSEEEYADDQTEEEQ